MSEPVMSETVSEAGVKVTTDGVSQTRRKSVGDREKTAGRLLRSSAERFYDAEVDIDWDAPPVPGAPWMSLHRVSLYGTKLWDKLTPEQRVELSRHEMASILTAGIYAETGLSIMLYRTVFEANKLASDHVRYALTEIGEETRHSVMFSRLLNKMGVDAYQIPPGIATKIAGKVYGLVSFAPSGPAAWGALLLIEEILDRGQREVMNDPDVQPHARQMMKIHVLEEARHITFAREELVRSIDQMGPLGKAIHRVALAAMANGVLPALVQPFVYQSVGINPLRGFVVAFTSAQYRTNAQFVSGPMARFLFDAGMAEGTVTRLLWLASRGVPEDVLEQVLDGGGYLRALAPKPLRRFIPRQSALPVVRKLPKVTELPRLPLPRVSDLVA